VSVCETDLGHISGAPRRGAPYQSLRTPGGQFWHDLPRFTASERLLSMRVNRSAGSELANILA